MNKRTIARLILCGFICSNLATAYTPEYLEKITGHHLQSFGTQPPAQAATPPFNPSDIKSFGDLWKFTKTLFQPNPFQKINLSEYEQRQRIARQAPADACSDQVIDDKADFVHRLELLHGPHESVEDHAFARLTSEHTLSKVGEKRLREMLAQPMIDTTELTRRSTLIKALVEDQ